MMNKEDQQRKYLEIQILMQQGKELQQQYQLLEQQLVELSTTIDSLNGIKNVKENSEVLASIGQGILFKANIKNPNELFINIGANTVAVKSVDEALSILKNQEEEFRDLLNQIAFEINNINSNLNQLNEGLTENE